MRKKVERPPKMDLSETINGEVMAAAFTIFLMDNHRGETQKFVDDVCQMSTGNKRKLAKLIVKICAEMPEPSVITTENDDVTNFFKHLYIIGSNLRMRD